MTKTFIKFTLALLFATLIFNSCQQKSKDEKDEKTQTDGQADLPWLKNAVIYEVNLRQFSASGKFKDFEVRLDSIKKLGVDILWFMPLQPIGIKNRKGSLGSYYSIKDYMAVNPEFGTLDEFRNLVEKCHQKGFKVILDWVGNHSSWDNKLITEHPDWYTKDSSGKIIAPVPDWSDVADLNYENKELRSYMINAMKWWIDECDLDGFRCDVAMMIPTDFWEEATKELNQTKKVFMLAEAEQPDHMLKAFHACYGWEFHHILKEIYKGNKNADSLRKYFEKTSDIYPAEAIKMHFVANHDENTWNGTTKESFGESEDAMTALSFALGGLPMIYNGMEAGLDKRLKFFDKDPIDWNKANGASRFEFYKTLAAIRHKNPAIWTNIDGQTNTQIFKTTKEVFAFIKQSGNNRVLVVANLSDKTVKMDALEIPGLEQFSLRLYKNMKTDGEHLYELGPWGYSLSTVNEPTE
jgi:glycosidase